MRFLPGWHDELDIEDAPKPERQSRSDPPASFGRRGRDGFDDPRVEETHDPHAKAQASLEPREAYLYQGGFVTLSAFSRGECSGQQASCGGGCPGPSAE